MMSRGVELRHLEPNVKGLVLLGLICLTAPACSGPGSPGAQQQVTVDADDSVGVRLGPDVEAGDVEADGSEAGGVAMDAGLDVMTNDSEATPVDGGGFDAGHFDAGHFDAGHFDVGHFDAGNFDAGHFDAGNFDAGHLDVGNFNVGDSDAGDVAPDAGGDVAAGDAGLGGTSIWAIGTDKVTVAWIALPKNRRMWTLTTTHPLRDNLPPSKHVTIQEFAGQPVLRSGHAGLDAVYALAVQESRDNSAKQLTDAAFNQGKAVPCPCFVTGEQWPWAWTRDVAYAVALGLGDLDPGRSAATLAFKTAMPKPGLAAGLPTAGGGRQIVQDTGSGGSWPVSTDRVVWALGAEALLDRLSGAARQAFVDQALAALRNTLETDRAVVWDEVDGLYRGEASFMDWREQSYPSWVKTDIVAIADAKALSTNVLFWHAHRVLARLATESGDTKLAAVHKGQAMALGTAILTRFALPGTPLLAALVGGPFDAAPSRRFELLGNVLAVKLGLVTGASARALVAAWPVSEAGPPVQWPQQPGVAIYHNRAIWPFVTAWYGLAAAQAGHAEAVHRSLRSLAEFAALNLSHMENLEFLTGKNFVADGALSGPVVNSRRQLWSVAGFIAAIHRVLLGFEASAQGIRFQPAVPRALRQSWFVGSDVVRLEHLMWRGHVLNIELILPKATTAQTGLYDVASMLVDGKAVPVGSWIAEPKLAATTTITLTLKAPVAADTSSVPTIQAADVATWLAPAEPVLTDPKLDGGAIAIAWSPISGADSYDVFRDGALVAAKVKATSWTDATSDPSLTAPCYAVAARAGALRSHHSAGRCWWGPGAQRIQAISAYKILGDDGTWNTTPSGASAAGLMDVGTTGKLLRVASVHPRHTGPHGLQLIYRNLHGPTQTGIACATARVRVRRLSDGKLLADGRVVLPQQGGDFLPSTVLPVQLDASAPVQIEIDRGDGLVNMSALAHYTAYNGGPGGGAQLFSRFDLQTVKLLSWAGPATLFTPTIQPNGQNDLDKLGAVNQVTPGASLATWDRFALTWDARFVTISVVSKAFEQGLRPFMLYLDVGSAGALTPALPSTGMPYDGLTAKLPFTPTHVVTLRSQTDAADGAGPWSGVYRATTQGWTQTSRFEAGEDLWLAGDKHTITVRIPRAQLGAIGKLRLAGHVVWAQPANEWKSIVPWVAMPWKNAATGYYELDVSQPPGVKSWLLK